MTPTIITAHPSAFTALDREAFFRMLQGSATVSGTGLRGRIDRASRLAFARCPGGSLLGIAALKVPDASYRARISVASGVDLNTRDFPYERGWLFVEPPMRGQGIGSALLKALSDILGGQSFYSVGAHHPTGHVHISAVEGLERVGRPFTGRVGQQLFVRVPMCMVHAAAGVCSYAINARILAHV
jgi:GNAT superfamily N-acetyltransferase